MSVTVASAEETFSKCKLLKNHLTFTMSQLVRLCIKKKLLDEIDIGAINNEFTSKTIRKTN